jgi:hypothetical protein
LRQTLNKNSFVFNGRFGGIFRISQLLFVRIGEFQWVTRAKAWKPVFLTFALGSLPATDHSHRNAIELHNTNSDFQKENVASHPGGARRDLI